MTDLVPVVRHAYLRRDIDNSLNAIEFAAATAQSATGAVNPDYARGYADAITAMRLALGLTIVPDDLPPVGCPRGHEQRRFVVVGER